MHSKEKDLSEIRQHWEKYETVSLKDKNLQALERERILTHLQKIKPKILADLGCGDGEDTAYFAKFCEKVSAFDYSRSMLEKAKKNLSGNKNITLDRLDILQDHIPGHYNAVVTKRMLINLGNFDNQKEAIKKISDALADNGYYIMLETSYDGLGNLNEMRKKVGLDEIPEPFHNTPFELEKLIEFLKNYFVVEDISYFSTYFFLTRVYNHLASPENYMELDAHARSVQEKLEIFGEKIIGPQFCLLLKKG